MLQSGNAKANSHKKVPSKKTASSKKKISNKKKASNKSISEFLHKGRLWTICAGRLIPPPGRPTTIKPLLKAVGEKIPFKLLQKCHNYLKKNEISLTGVYIAHDSMGYPRYVGRGAIFTRLAARKKAQKLELSYFSFFVVEESQHQREIETIMIRAAGPLLDFNSRKVRIDIEPGDIRDFEPGTVFLTRQYTKGRKS